MKKSLLITILSIAVGALLLRIFIPWWVISLLMGIIAVLAIYSWTAANTPIPEPWAKKVLLIAAIFFAISLTMSFVSQKWPWVDKAFDDRQLYSSFAAADLIDPKYPDLLAQNVYQTERMKIRAEESQLNALLAVTQRKLADGIPLTATDEAVVKRAKERLTALDKELVNVNIARPKTETNNQNGPSPWPWRLVFFGLIMISVLLIPEKLIKVPGKGLIGLVGVIVLFVGAAFVVFPEIQPDFRPSRPAPSAKTSRAAPRRATELPPNAVFVKTMTPGEVVHLVRTSMDAPPPERWTTGPMGDAVKEPPWPINERSRGLRNTTNEIIKLFVVGQRVTISNGSRPTPPVSQAPMPIQQASSVSTGDECLLDQAFGPK